MRIIAGEWRARQLAAPAGRTTRPTTDRAREAWMSVVHPSLDDATSAMEELLRHMEPCGMGNPGPVFSARGVRMLSGPTTIGSDGVKLQLATTNGPLEAVGWGLAHRSSELAAARSGTVEIVFKLGRNEYRGASTLQATLVDFRVEDAP